MSEMIHRSERCTVEVFKEEGEKRIRRIINAELPLYDALKNSDCKYLPKIFSVEISDKKTVVTEEFIDGKNLIFANLNEKQILKAMLQLCSALEYIHSLGIVHRDIKPSNILIDKDGNIRLIDFEAARFVREDKVKDTHYLGTDGFAPPEQYGFSQTDFRSDIYAFGQTMKMLLGSLSAKPEYAKIIRKCTALDPAERYRSAGELYAALTKKRGKISAAIFIGAGLCIILAAAFFSRIIFAETPSELSADITDFQSGAADIGGKSYVTESLETSAETASSEALPRSAAPESEISVSTSFESFFEPDDNGLTYYGIPENMPDYERKDLLFFPEDENAKILFADGNALFNEHRKFYMYFDMDCDGKNEAIFAEVDDLEHLNVKITYGVQDMTEGVYYEILCFWSEYLLDYDYINIDENSILQVTCFETDNDGRYAAVTVGDGKSYNITEFYAVRNDMIEYVGSGWGETTAVMYGTGLNIYFDGGGQNLYSLNDGRLTAVNEYDYEEYNKILNGEYSSEETFEKIARKPEGY